MTNLAVNAKQESLSNHLIKYLYEACDIISVMRIKELSHPLFS
jgi:hypothetical protein